MGVLRGLLADLADLVLPSMCAGCGARPAPVVCARCVAALTAARPHRAMPDPSPPGLPPCTAFGDYDGVLRELLLGYKERGRHDAARPLAALLAESVSAAVEAAQPVLLVPVPATARAARQRYGDHVHRLARLAARALRARGRPVRVTAALRALPRPDSAGLDSATRLALAQQTFRVRPRCVPAVRRAVEAGVALVIVDDIITTGATLATVATRLGDIGVDIRNAAVIAATRRRAVVDPARRLGDSVGNGLGNKG
jgi:predicted amidophosphoribosyltransferase